MFAILFLRSDAEGWLCNTVTVVISILDKEQKRGHVADIYGNSLRFCSPVVLCFVSIPSECLPSSERTKHRRRYVGGT